MAKLPTIAVCYLAGVDSTQIAQRRGPSRITDALPDHPILDMRDRTPADLGDNERARLADVEIAFILDMPDYIFEAFPNLKWIHSLKTGHDHIPLDELRKRGIRLTNGAGTAATEIAEFVIARILEHWKRLPQIAAQQVEHRWYPAFGRALSDCDIVLVGYGPINQEVARLLAPFNVKLTAVRRSADAPSPGASHTVTFAEMNGALASADVVVAAVPSNADTTDLFDAAAFAAMKPGCFVVNVGRGTAVVEADLMASLASGHLGGAALDVTSEEPLPPDNPLWDSAARISPHSSATLAKTMRRVHDLFIRNVGLYSAGARLDNEVEI
ncbi:MAG: NAD(P)-dependent oxidoreductase [Actinomycetota bacterium]